MDFDGSHGMYRVNILRGWTLIEMGKIMIFDCYERDKYRKNYREQNLYVTRNNFVNYIKYGHVNNSKIAKIFYK